MTSIPDRSGEDIPPQVEWFLSVCETGCAYTEWIQENIDTQQRNFCKGVADYWNMHDVSAEPTFDMLFHKPLDADENLQGWPTQEEIAYQKGAIVGYDLAEQYK